MCVYVCLDVCALMCVCVPGRRGRQEARGGGADDAQRAGRERSAGHAAGTPGPQSGDVPWLFSQFIQHM